MNFLKMIICCIILGNTILYTQENQTESTLQDTKTPEGLEKKEELINSTALAETVTSPSELFQWHNHLQALLVKDAHWDSNTQTPNTKWQNDAIDIAEQVLQNDVSHAEELKSSFLSTIQDKFTDIEKSTNLSDAFSIIGNFNSFVDKFVKKMADKEKTGDVVENVSTSEKNSPDVANQEPIISEPEEQAIQNSPDDITDIQASEDSEDEKKKQKQLSQWQEILNNIKTEGTDETEVKAIIDEATTVAQGILQSISEEIEKNNQADSMKDEFEQAVQQRSQDVLPIKSFNIAMFNNKIDAVLQGKSTEEMTTQAFPAIPAQQPITFEQPISVPKQPTKTNSNGIPEEKTVVQTPQKKSTNVTAQPTSPSSTTIITTTTAIPERQPIVTSQKNTESAIKTKENQESLVRIQLAAAQKVATEKEASKKGIISSFMGAVLGEWWTGPSAAEKTLQEIRQEQDSLLETITAKFKPDDKALIKTAYHSFQEKLLTFDINKLWDTQSDKPKDDFNKWIRKIESSLKVLIKYNVMDIDTISNTLKETLKTNTKMPIKCYAAITETIIPALKRYVIELEEEKVQQQKQHEEELKKQQQEQLDREQRTQQRLKQEEQDKQDAIKKQFEEKNKARADFKNQKDQWQQLMQQIETSKPASNEKNNEFTKKALNITKNMLEKLPLLPEENKKNITDDHKAAFSNALLKQQTENPDVQVFLYIDTFNKAIYAL